MTSIVGTSGAQQRLVAEVMEEGGRWIARKPRLRVGQLVTSRRSPTGWVRIVATEDATSGDPDHMETWQHYTHEVAPAPTTA